MKTRHAWTVALLVGLVSANVATSQERAKPTAGYRVYLDPGHGGVQGHGAKGPQGLYEEDANWEVAHALRQLLVADGMQVRLSHEEKDAQELTLREVTADAARWDADVFVSIHHNADAALRDWINRTEVFYHVNDDGASADLARLLNDELTDLLDLPHSRPKSVFAYWVLRAPEIQVPAVLGEALHLMNPEGERWLMDPANIQAQAAAYHRAITTWLRRGIPRTRSLEVEEHGGRLRITADLDAPGGLDPTSVRLELNGAPLPATIDTTARRVEALAAGPVRAGSHSVTLRFRNNAGNAARTTRQEVYVPFRFHHCDIEISPAAMLERDGQYNRVLVTPLDHNGLPAPPDVSVFLEGTRGSELIFAPFQRHGEHWSIAMTPAMRQGARLTVRVDDGETSRSQPLVWLPSARETSAVLCGTLRSLHDGRPIGNAMGVLDGDPPQTFHTAPDGWYRIDAAAWQGRALTWHAPGFRVKSVPVPTLTETSVVDEELTPWFGGVLVGRSVVLDASGGADALGRANLAVARHLADYLTLAGARVTLIRENDDPQAMDTRVAKSLAADSDYVVLLTFEEPRVHADEPSDLSASRGFHKWGDRSQLLAQHLAEGCRRVFGAQEADIRVSDDWLVMHGHRGFEAVAVSPFLLSRRDDHRRVRQPMTQRLAALGTLYGMVRHAALGSANPDLVVTLKDLLVDLQDADGNPVTQALLIVDDTLAIPPDANGRCTVAYQTPGDHVLYAEGAAGRAGPRTVRLEDDETRLTLTLER